MSSIADPESNTVTDDTTAAEPGSSTVIVPGEPPAEETPENTDIMDWARKLGYRKMGVEVFHKLQVC